jgi:hypothetical protein
MAFAARDNRLEVALGLFTTQFKEKPNIEGLAQAFSLDLQEFETSLEALINDVGLETASGVQLDGIGEILDVQRAGRTDDIYRTRLFAAVLQYTSSGRWEQVIQGFKLLTQADAVQGGEVYPGSVTLAAVGADPITIDTTELLLAMQNTRAVGVRLEAVLVSADPPLVFEGDPYPGGAGFDDGSGSVGGHFSSILTI